MSDYRRVRIPGGCYFFTVNLAVRGNNDLLVLHWPMLRAVIADVRRARPFRIDAFVVLPDHLHSVWTLPEGDADIAVRWMLIKTGFSRRLPPGEPRSTSRRHRGERGIWQRRFWEHAIRDNRDFAAHVDYVHFNPVRHGYVSEPAAWPHSTYRQHCEGLR